jgi:Glycosyl hydrolase 108
MATDADFATAVQFVLQQEGGYVANPADPGGETKYGITKRSYPELDIAALTVDAARQIYYTDYWQQSGADALPMPLAMVVLDTAVNMGTGAARTLLQQSGGDVTQYLALRKERYDAIVAARPAMGVFLDGWLKRLNALAAAAVTPAGLGVAAAIGLGLFILLAGRGRT